MAPWFYNEKFPAWAIASLQKLHVNWQTALNVKYGSVKGKTEASLRNSSELVVTWFQNKKKSRLQHSRIRHNMWIEVHSSVPQSNFLRRVPAVLPNSTYIGTNVEQFTRSAKCNGSVSYHREKDIFITAYYINLVIDCLARYSFSQRIPASVEDGYKFTSTGGRRYIFLSEGRRISRQCGQPTSKVRKVTGFGPLYFGLSLSLKTSGMGIWKKTWKEIRICGDVSPYFVVQGTCPPSTRFRCPYTSIRKFFVWLPRHW